MEFDITNALDVHYVKLHFTILFPEDSKLPVHKASAIRGGMGEMLLRANCIRDRKCEACDFKTECIVQRTMYSQFDVKPDFITSGESIGYVVECENYEEYFQAGETLKFNLILFGKNIVYLNQYLQALFALGQSGLGKGHCLFVITEVRNTRQQPILDGTNVYMKYYQVERLLDYVTYRKKKIEEHGLENGIYFHTPLTQKYQGEFLQEFQMDAIIKSVQRRLYMLNCFEGKHLDEIYDKQLETPKILWQEPRYIQVKRYSNRQDSPMQLKGIKGKIQLEEIPNELLDLLLAGELIHIGKNTSFGFGRYTLD